MLMATSSLERSPTSLMPLRQFVMSGCQRPAVSTRRLGDGRQAKPPWTTPRCADIPRPRGGRHAAEAVGSSDRCWGCCARGRRRVPPARRPELRERRVKEYPIDCFLSEEGGGSIADIPDLDACAAFGD